MAATSRKFATLNASAFPCSAAKGRGMKAMPKGPPVKLWKFSATSWIEMATPNVVIAR